MLDDLHKNSLREYFFRETKKNEKLDSKFTISKLYLVTFYNSQQQAKKQASATGGLPGASGTLLLFLAIKCKYVSRSELGGSAERAKVR